MDEKGTPGPYQWMTYKAAAEARTDIGSGLLHFGLSSGCTLGLYSVNCRGALWPTTRMSLSGVQCTIVPACEPCRKTVDVAP